MLRRSALAVGLVALALLPAPSAASTPGTVTVIGDSIFASMRHDERARQLLTRGLRARLHLAVCRRLVERSCRYRGARPPTALEVVRRRGHGLGPALVLGVGYNDAARGFGADLEQVLRAARKRGVQRIVLVTLRQTRPPYRAINRQIRAVARRHADVVVADWHARSRGQRRWIAADGMHLSPVGARALARFLHPFAVRAAQG